jgi:lipopolysaccharide/colanic/teichoic acid biosynthesis glycosyltransferase
LIRRTSIGELPQLLNVLKGDMSLVGPRPVPTYEVDDYSPQHFQRFESLPGISGYWQVYGRGSVPFEEMMQMDIFYVKNRTLLMDLKLLLLTLPAVVSTKGAN